MYIHELYDKREIVIKKRKKQQDMCISIHYCISSASSLKLKAILLTEQKVLVLTRRFWRHFSVCQSTDAITLER